MAIDTAVVLAGGPGNRLKPLTKDTPKPLVKIQGKPLLQWVIEWLKQNDVTNIIIGVAHRKEEIMKYFGRGSKFGVNITYSVHSVEGGTGEGFYLAISRFVDKDVFFAMNGDQVTDLDLSELAAFHFKHGPIATVTVTNPPCPFGILEIDGQFVVKGFSEKPHCPSVFCSAGIYVFDRKITGYLPQKGDIEEITFPNLSKASSLMAYPFRGFFITVNTLKDLVRAEDELRKRKR